MIKVRRKPKTRICQGDIFRDVEYIEDISESSGVIRISKIVFPLVVILTQDCDLEQDHTLRNDSRRNATQDKFLLSVLVAPLYNAEHVYLGQHLSELDLKMQEINKKRTPGTNLRNNETPRYHYLEFPKDVPIVASVVDFKHYFSVNVSYLKNLRKSNFVCSLSDLFREDLSHRFASFLSRIGLPELTDNS